MTPTTRLAFIVCFTSTLFASPTGRIQGIVRDPSGAAVTRARITLAAAGSAERREVVPDPNGAFELLDLSPGAWDLAADADGFRRLLLSNLIVHVDQTTRLEIHLQLGERSDTVEVAASAPGIETSRPTVQTIIDARTVASMPLNGRQYLDLALLASGTVPAAPGTQGSGFSVAGIRSQSNVYLLDGISNIDTQTNQPLNLFRINDAVREFAVQSSVSLPEFGRGAGAQVNVVTRSGGNSLHGSAFEYLRNTKLTAADFFTNKLGGPKNALNRNQFGATAGAPIRRDRTFVFASYEGFRQIAPAVASTIVPTAGQRATVTDPISQRLLAFYPLPNAGGALNYIANVRNLDSDDTALIRLDHHAGPRDQLSARWTQYWGSSTVPGATPLSGGNTGPLSQVSAMLGESHTFSASLLNELRLGFSRYTTQRTVQDAGFDAGSIFTASDGAALAGVPRNSGLPSIAIGGGFAALGSNANFPQARVSNTTEIFDNVSAVAPFGASRHTFRWGGHVRREDLNRNLDRSARGSVNFANFADFARGQLNSATIRTGSTQSYWRRYPWDLYWQDEFRASESLTLTFGLRYESPSGYPGAARTRHRLPARLRPDARGHEPGSRNRPCAAWSGRDRLRYGAGATSRRRRLCRPQQLRAHARVRLGPGTQRQHRDSRRFPRRVRRSLQQRSLCDGSRGADEPANHPDRQCNPACEIRMAAGVRSIGPTRFECRPPGTGTPASGILNFQALDPRLRSAQAYVYNFSIQRRLRLSGDRGGLPGQRRPPSRDVYRRQPAHRNRARPDAPRTGCAERTDLSISQLRSGPDREIHRQFAL